MTNSKKQAMFEKMREFVAEARNQNVRFKTFNVASDLPKPAHSGRIVVAYSKSYSQENQLWVAIGVAFCSPKDEFTRLQGRGIASARLLNKPFHVRLDNGKLAEDLRVAVLAIADAKGVTWMRGKDLVDLR